MRIVVTSDLHYNIKRSRKATEELVFTLRKIGADIFIIAGDIAGVDTRPFEEALSLFSDIAEIKLAVLGNHDLWVSDGLSSLDKARLLGKLAQEYGFSLLDTSPCVVDSVGIVGTIGWYDYSLRDYRLKVPLDFYRAKIGPGRVLLLKERYKDDFRYMGHLLQFAHVDKDILLGLKDITSIWNDRNFVRLPFSDEEFAERLSSQLREDIEKVEKVVDSIVVIMHHLPTRELVLYRGDPNWDFAAAFLGSSRFYEEVLYHTQKVRYCFCGHNHRFAEWYDGRIRFISIGSTYREKSFYILDI